MSATDLGVFNLPSMIPGAKAMPTFGLGQSWIMSSSSKNKEAAYRFLDYINSEDYIKTLAKLKAWVYGAPAINVSLATKNAMPSIMKTAVESMKNGAGYNPSVFVSAPVKTAYYTAIQAIISGQKTPEQVQKDIQAAKDTQ